jgi:hypothetical protein|tara:strand:+ start:186 stop:629 length:444 start_codon:yes stop_codon:yes gene_type:complete
MTETALAEETRYWERVGMYVTREFADQWIERIGVRGQVLDDDLEEFNAISLPDADLLRREINSLFDSPPNMGELAPENQAILALMDFERQRKDFIRERRQMLLDDGVDSSEALTQAKSDYDEAKENLVRGALGMPSVEEEEAVTEEE